MVKEILRAICKERRKRPWIQLGKKAMDITHVYSNWDTLFLSLENSNTQIGTPYFLAWRARISIPVSAKKSSVPLFKETPLFTPLLQCCLIKGILAKSVAADALLFFAATTQPDITNSNIDFGGCKGDGEEQGV